MLFRSDYFSKQKFFSSNCIFKASTDAWVKDHVVKELLRLGVFLTLEQEAIAKDTGKDTRVLSNHSLLHQSTSVSI